MSMTRTTGAAIRMLLVATFALGVVYPLAGLAIGRLFATQADGSLLTIDGAVVGSALLGQDVDGDTWFYGRPSANDGDAMASGGSNLGPNSEILAAQIRERRADIAKREGVQPADVPADAVTASGSGLDPGISVAYAELQVARVARERGLDVATVRALVDDATTHGSWFALGQTTVNVTQVNVALARLER